MIGAIWILISKFVEKARLAVFFLLAKLDILSIKLFILKKGGLVVQKISVRNFSDQLVASLERVCGNG